MLLAFALYAVCTGHYDVELTTDKQTFHDEMEITALAPHMTFPMFHSVKGTYTVPGIFTAEIKNGSVTATGKFKEQRVLNFEIEANENGQKYPVYFKIDRSIDDKMVGEATLDSGKLGEIKLTRKEGPCE